MSQHTPGPWRAGKIGYRDSGDYEIRDESGALIAETFELIGKHRATVNPRENASLIAAAPELLAAAIAVVDRWDSPLWKDQPATGEYIARIRKAIAKAKAAA